MTFRRGSVLVVVGLMIGSLMSCGSASTGDNAFQGSPPPTAANAEASTSDSSANTTSSVVAPVAPTATPIPATATIPTSPPTALPVLPTTTPTPVPEISPDVLLTELGLDVNTTADCATPTDRRDAYPPRVEITCPRGTSFHSPGRGYVIGLSHDAADPSATSTAPASQPSWAWTDGAAFGPYVVIDQGPAAGWGNVTTIIRGVVPSADLRIGSIVDTATVIGTTGEGAVSLQPWFGSAPFATQTVEAAPPGLDEAVLIAQGIGAVLTAPVDDTCRLELTAPSVLPNSGRPYRSGIHQGVDVICGVPGTSAYASLDGTVIAVVNDFTDSPVQPRLDVLNNAALAGYTPHWTLSFLYGNFVVMEHQDPDGREVITISAHLESVDPEIVVGRKLAAGTRLGEVGNRGTGPSAAGTTAAWDGSRHLHWEIFVDGIYLGAGLGPADTAAVYQDLLCPEAHITGCP